MSESVLPVEVQDFIARHITSVEQMELLVLFVSNPKRVWTIPQLVNELRSSQLSIDQRLQKLLEGGCIAHEGETFRFAPASPEKAALWQKSTLAYRDYHVRVIELIYRRTDPLKDFSDAFKLKPKPKE